MKQIAILTLFIIMFCSCNPNNAKKNIMEIGEKLEQKYRQSIKPQREDIIGRWVSDDGAEFQFNDDSTFTITNIPESTFWGNCESKKLFSYNGTWSLEYSKSLYRWKIELTMSSEYFFPKGSNGFCGNEIDVEKNLFANSRILSFFDEEFVEKNFFVSSNWLLIIMDFCDDENLYVFKRISP